MNSAAIKDFDGNQLSGDFNLNFTTGQEFERLAGGTRYETSVAISKSLDSHSGYVVMATGENFPDALCSAPLAAKYEAPILLTNRDSIPAAVENEIDSPSKEAFIVTGSNYPDALSGAALAGAYGSPIILADDSMPDYIVDFLNENKDIMKMKKILGGTGAVSDTIINRIFK